MIVNFRSALCPLLLILASCRASVGPAKISELVQEFVSTSLSFSPVSATAAGYHVHNGVPLDEQLDGYDERDLDRQRQFYREFRGRLEGISSESLPPDERADYDILLDQTTLALLELDTIQNYKHNPTVYVELIGNALFNPLVQEYASIEDRFTHITRRLSRLPALLGEARRNLADSPEIWTQVAARENDGNHDLLVNVLTAKCPPGNRAQFDRSSREALRALDEFTTWLNTELMRKKSDWRLGKEKYGLKFGPGLQLGLTPEQVLADAEAELRARRQEMFALAGPLRAKLIPGAKDSPDLNTVVRETLARIAGRHGSRETYFEDARRDLAEIREFASARNFVTLPVRDNLQVIETPQFMRGIYAVGGFNPAPALQPKLGAFYWITPIPETMEAARVESKLREYNFYGLKLLTIHEAIPGHYLQFEFANDVQPQSRRLLRAVFGNQPYVEGWAVYATELMVDQGYLDSDPQLKLTWLKQYLRAVANTILDIRLQTMNMSDEQAMDLMINQTFQEKEEATAKLQRAKLSSVQLPAYFTGFRAWKRLRSSVQQKRGAGFDLKAFHDQALKSGAVPMPSLERIIGAAKP